MSTIEQAYLDILLVFNRSPSDAVKCFWTKGFHIKQDTERQARGPAASLKSSGNPVTIIHIQSYSILKMLERISWKSIYK